MAQILFYAYINLLRNNLSNDTRRLITTEELEDMLIKAWAYWYNPEQTMDVKLNEYLTELRFSKKISEES